MWPFDKKETDQEFADRIGIKAFDMIHVHITGIPMISGAEPAPDGTCGPLRGR